MKLIKDFKEGMHISDVYLCKTRQVQLTKAGKEYLSVIFQDRSGTIDGKVWDLGNPGICEFESKDFVAIEADVTLFNQNLQLNVRRIRKADEAEYNESDYLPVSAKNIGEMYDELIGYVDSVRDKYLKALLRAMFVEDGSFIAAFKFSSAAKAVHHSFVGGLLEHTLAVAKLCDFYCSQYAYLNRDILITAAICHDIGKVKELTPYPDNDYSDEGQLIGHIVMGVEMLDERIRLIDGFPDRLAGELKHCILAHHGEFEFGSPKKPAIAEAFALNLADNTDAKIELMKETLEAAGNNNGWLGYNRFLDSNVRKTLG